MIEMLMSQDFKGIKSKIQSIGQMIKASHASKANNVTTTLKC